MLEKENILLRAIEPEDVDFIFEMENNCDIWHISNTNNPFSRFDIEQYVMLADKDIYTAKQLRFIIEDKSEGRPLGMIDVFDFDAHHSRAGIGILIKDDERSKGMGSIALDILVKYMFTQLNIHQLFCNIGTDNIKSISLFTGRGFVKAGSKKDWNLINNRWVDEDFYQLLNENQKKH